MIKIFHCGDIHLDAPFASASPQESQAKRIALRERFMQMIQFAKDENVSLVLIPGDLFDSGFIQPLTEKAIADAFKSLPCPVVISPGNHDPYDDGGIYKSVHFSPNVFIFNSEQCTRFDFDDIGVSVTGYAFTSRSHTEKPLADRGSYSLSEKNINILSAHTDIYSPISAYAPISESELESSGFVYAALAHVHKAPEVMKFGDTIAAYSGFAEGRGFDECGSGGAWLVKIDKPAASGQKYSVECERVCISPPSYAIESCDITGAGSDAEAASLIDKALKNEDYPPSVTLRIILRGNVTMTYAPSASAIIRLLNIKARCEIRDMTEPLFDADFLEKDLTIKGEFYRILSKKISSGTPDEKRVAALALRYGLCAMSGQDIIIE